MSPPERWTLGRALGWTRTYFASRNLASPRLDAELLLAHALGVGRVVLYTDDQRPLTAAELATFRLLVRRRAVGEPVAYLLGHREFYGHRFAVDRRVLVPRPETEHLVDEALAALAGGDGRPRHLVDVGTGSGAVALSIALGLGAADPLQVTATDASADALAVAAANGRALWPDHGERLVLLHGSLLAPARARLAAHPADLVVANLPYVPRAAIAALPVDVRDFEPHQALDGGSDGLGWVRQLMAEVPAHLAPGGRLMLEVGAGQADAVVALAAAAGGWGPARRVTDLAGHERVVVLARAGKGAC